MIKSPDSTVPSERSASFPGKCWHREEGTRTIRVITADKGRFTFPYSHFVRGHLEDTDDGKERLTLSFSSDTVEIHGKRLEPLEKALDGLSLAWVRVLPSRHAPLASEGSPVVTEIAVCPTTDTSTAAS
ncbi:MAG: hypothetical protein QM680_07665 [Luteolibacter sp.]